MRSARPAAVLAAILAGLASVALLGGPLGPAALAAAVLCSAGPWLAPRLVAAPWPIVTLLVLVGIGSWVWFEGSPRMALGVALVYLQVHRVLGRVGPSDDRVSLLLSGLMLVAAASSSEDIRWFGAFLAWILTVPIALLPPGFRARRGSVVQVVVALSGGTLLLSAMAFPMLPRLRSAGEELDPARTGFTPTVELGAIDALLDDDGEVFRVQASPDFPEVPLYFRGVVLDRFDGRSWSSTVSANRAGFQAPSSYPEDSLILRFAGEAPDGALFTAGQVLHVESGGQPLRRDRHGAWRLESEPDGLVEWMVVARAPWGPGSAMSDLDPPRPGSFLQLPDGLDPRIRALADEIRGDETSPRRVADRVADWLASQTRYTRVPRDAGTEEPLATFLFDRRTGHCEYYASALAVLVRSVGVPARVVNGFVGGEFDPDSGHLVVRAFHAHAWAEVWVPERGWVVIDATPGPGFRGTRGGLAAVGDALRDWWDRSVLDFDGDRQREAMVAAGTAVESALRTRPSGSTPWLGLVVIWSLALVAAVLADRLLRRVGARLAGEGGPRPPGAVDRAWWSARRSVEKRTGPAPGSLPPLSVAQWLGERDAGVADHLVELAWLVYRVRHGGEEASEHAERARWLAKRVQAAARRGTDP